MSTSKGPGTMRSSWLAILLTLSVLSFPAFAPGAEYEANRVKVEVVRMLKGRLSGQMFYGDLDGKIHLPHDKGGTLSFRFWNDQRVGFSASLNQIRVRVAGMVKTFTQYTTSLDLEETYEGGNNEWGPAGGARITIQIPPRAKVVHFSGQGSQTGIEISDLVFLDDAPVFFQMEEQTNYSQEVLISSGRQLFGKSTGREYHGDSRINIILPHNKGGILSLLFWNDQQSTAAKTTNYLNYNLGGRTYTVEQATTPKDLAEFYKEFSGSWGPAGGMEVRIYIPPGTQSFTITATGSDTGIEVSDLVYY